MPDAEATIHQAIRALLALRGADAGELLPDRKLTAEIGLDSLELAELSAVLEDDLGSDPFSEGLVPETVGELVGFYRN